MGVLTIEHLLTNSLFLYTFTEFYFECVYGHACMYPLFLKIFTKFYFSFVCIYVCIYAQPCLTDSDFFLFV